MKVEKTNKLYEPLIITLQDQEEKNCLTEILRHFDCALGTHPFLEKEKKFANYMRKKIDDHYNDPSILKYTRDFWDYIEMRNEQELKKSARREEDLEKLWEHRIERLKNESREIKKRV